MFPLGDRNGGGRMSAGWKGLRWGTLASSCARATWGSRGPRSLRGHPTHTAAPCTGSPSGSQPPVSKNVVKACNALRSSDARRDTHTHQSHHCVRSCTNLPNRHAPLVLIFSHLLNCVSGQRCQRANVSARIQHRQNAHSVPHTSI